MRRALLLSGFVFVVFALWHFGAGPYARLESAAAVEPGRIVLDESLFVRHDATALRRARAAWGAFGRGLYTSFLWADAGFALLQALLLGLCLGALRRGQSWFLLLPAGAAFADLVENVLLARWLHGAIDEPLATGLFVATTVKALLFGAAVLSLLVFGAATLRARLAKRPAVKLATGAAAL